MLTTDHVAITASHEQQLRQMQIKEMELFSNQLSTLASIAAFLSCNSFFGLMEVMDIEKDTPTVQICITLFYFINVSVSFCCTVTVAVCSEFVIFYGWEKALKGPTSDMNKTISRMHSFRKLMMKLLVLGVGTSMMMGATMQLSRPQKDGQVHHKYAAIVCGVVLLFTVFMVVTSRDITRAFSLGDYSYSSQASERAGLKGIQQPVINREDYIPYTMASPVKGKTAAASGAAGAGLAAGAEPARKKSWFAGGRKGSSSSK